jgi:hypothetical protein
MPSMRFSRRTRWFAVVLALFGMLCMQLAVAAYACPKVDNEAQAEMMANMPGCTGMDNTQPSLCKSHCHPKQQLVDKAELPPVAPFALSGLGYLAGITVAPPVPQPADAFARAQQARATAPPLAIANCCFRI